VTMKVLALVERSNNGEKNHGWTKVEGSCL